MEGRLQTEETAAGPVVVRPRVGEGPKVEGEPGLGVRSGTLPPESLELQTTLALQKSLHLSPEHAAREEPPLQERPPLPPATGVPLPAVP